MKFPLNCCTSINYIQIEFIYFLSFMTIKVHEIPKNKLPQFVFVYVFNRLKEINFWEDLVLQSFQSPSSIVMLSHLHRFIVDLFQHRRCLQQLPPSPSIYPLSQLHRTSDEGCTYQASTWSRVEKCRLQYGLRGIFSTTNSSLYLDADLREETSNGIVEAPKSSLLL